MPKPRIVVTGDSEQAVAFGLLQMLMQAGDAPRDRAGILAAYRACLETVRGAGARPPARPPLPLPPEEAPADEEDEPAGEEDAAPHPPAPPRRRKPRRGA